MANKYNFEPIEDALTFEPNEQEFSDPLSYINEIRPIAEKHGICKIIPPKNWKPQFCIDMDTFKFTPRIQKLNELEAGSRMKMNFIEKLDNFWQLQGQKLRIPTIERKQLDLYKLYSLVNKRGEKDNLTDLNFWIEISKEMNFKETSAKTLKTNYEKLIYPYILIKSGVTVPKSTSTTPIKRTQTEEDKDDEPQQNKRKKRKTAKKYENINCLICTRGDDDAFILLCDECDDSYHTYCLYPALNEIPEGDWRCPNCIAEICKKPTDSYGFEQSKKKYSLNEFGLMANKFKENHFKKKKQSITSDEIEREFWRILASPNESIVVEYGADLHTLEIGSGFPTISYKGESKSNDKYYLESPWNLNNLPKLDKSILSQMNADISGMKIPWAYVGMLFSCFCWHVEDHWSYSINYLHWGETKTWYGVSGLEAEKFEQIMKKNAEDLFESSPDLLHHLVTIIDPSTLKKSGVPVYRLNQNAGEFVITFPRAYHAGFNQGFNFAEAVNFCPADWIPIGRAAVENYKISKRHTVFSHDELVFKTACSKSVFDSNIIEAIQNELKQLIQLEKNNHIHFKDKINNWKQVTFELLTDDERTCDYCHTTCFLSAIKCSCSPTKLACPNHLEHICTETTNKTSIKNTKQKQIQHKKTFIHRYSVDEMQKILNELLLLTNDYKKWCRKVNSILLQKCINQQLEVIDLENGQQEQIEPNRKRPKLNDLEQLLDQAKQNNFDKFDYGQKLFTKLTNSIRKVEICIRESQKIIQLFKKTDQQIQPKPDDDIIFVKKVNYKSVSIDDIKELIGSFDYIACEIDEKQLILSIYTEIDEHDKKIDKLIQDWNTNLSTMNQRRYLEYLDNLNIQFDYFKIKELKKLYEQSVWIELVNSKMNNPMELTTKDLNNLIDKFLYNELKNNSNNAMKYYRNLVELLSIAQYWENKAKELLDSKTPLQIQLLEKTYSEANEIPAKLLYAEKMKQIINESKDLSLKIKQVLDKKAPSLDHLIDLFNESKKNNVSIKNLDIVQTKIELTNDWLIKLNSIFKIKQTDQSILLILSPRIDLQTTLDVLHQLTKTCELNDLNETTVIDFYNQNLLNIKEKIKQAESIEIELIKKLRLNNLDKLKQIQQLSSIENNSESLKKLNLKCCSCFKSIQSSLSTNKVDYCKLCFGIYHSSCKLNQSTMCTNCKRSKRPHVDQIYELLLQFDKLDVSFSINKALQLSFSRFTKWQEQFDKFFNDNLAQLKLMFKNSEFNSLKRIFDGMPSFKKVELNEIYLESLLLETQNEFIQFIKDFCEKIELDNYYYKCDFQQFSDCLSKFDKCNDSEQMSSQQINKKSKRISNKKTLITNERKKIKKPICLLSNNTTEEIIDLNEESLDSDAESETDLKERSKASKFCYCKRGDFGQMICCDNLKCKIEWFHFECVKLKIKPKGKWYCPNCRT